MFVKAEPSGDGSVFSGLPWAIERGASSRAANKPSALTENKEGAAEFGSRAAFMPEAVTTGATKWIIGKGNETWAEQANARQAVK